MLFNSYIFILCFLPISVLGYFSINKILSTQGEWPALAWLSFVSFCFFAYAGIEFIPVLLGSILCNYGLGYGIKKQNSLFIRKLILCIGIGLNLILLFYFKYIPFFQEILKPLKDILGEIQIAVPLGISFFTFSQISYLVDCYKMTGCEQYGFLKYCTYISFFPKLTMGPIALANDFMSNIKIKTKPEYGNLGKGIYLFSLGLAKKILLADLLANIVSIGYSDVAQMNTITAIVVMLSYTFQLYFDFSGYCDMAVGIGLLFNIELPVNFDSPYGARTIGEFWKRWHITLTRFFTGYLYIPLGGNKKGKLRTYFNTLIVFLISGLWHGANWTFLFWGGIHGSCMVLEKLIKDMGLTFKELPIIVRKIKESVQWIFTFGIVNVAWIFFRAESVEQAVNFLKQMTVGGWQISEGIIEYVKDIIEIRILMRLGLDSFVEGYPSLFIILLLVAIMWICLFKQNTNEKAKYFNFSKGKGVITVILLLWCIISLSNISEFLYFDF